MLAKIHIMFFTYLIHGSTSLAIVMFFAFYSFLLPFLIVNLSEILIVCICGIHNLLDHFAECETLARASCSQRCPIFHSNTGVVGRIMHCFIINVNVLEQICHGFFILNVPW